MVKSDYIPERGDVVWLNFTPQAGHEQMGNRPAVVISPKEYNKRVGLGIFCPITSKEKGYPFEVKIKVKKIDGVIISDQVKSMDWKSRGIEYIGKIGKEELEEVIEKISVLIFV
jgi:mRNA interferase MazF